MFKIQMNMLQLLIAGSSRIKFIKIHSDVILKITFKGFMWFKLQKKLYNSAVIY